MSNQHRFSLQALAAIVRELDDKLTDLNRAELADHHEHLVWLATGASILADLAIEQANSTPDPKGEPEPCAWPIFASTPKNLTVIDGRPVRQFVAIECRLGDDGDEFWSSRHYEPTAALVADEYPARITIDPIADRDTVVRLLRKAAEEVASGFDHVFVGCDGESKEGAQ